jgi:predicted  nucleic acid-binding Zn-ribbon protein
MNSSDYREAAVALARLASLDAEIGQCHSRADDVEGSVGRLRGRLDDMSTGLAARHSATSGDGAGRPETEGEAARERARYRRLFEEYQDFVRIARSRTRLLRNELRVLELRRKRLEGQIPAPLLTAYESLTRAGRKPAAALLKDGVCGGCRALVGPDLQELITGRRGPLHCPRCERFLLPASWDRHD